MSDLVPQWSISTWIYSHYPGSATDALCADGTLPTTPGGKDCKDGSIPTFVENDWIAAVQASINSYNNAQTNPTCKINMIYPYAADLELPWVSQTFLGNGTPPSPISDGPPINAGQSQYWSLSDPTKPTCAYGIDFVKTTGAWNTPLPAQEGNTTPVPLIADIEISSLPSTNYRSVIVDGRIDNGYLQGLNEFLTATDAQNLAKLIVDGGYSQLPKNPTTSFGQVGIGAFGPKNSSNYQPTIHGIQLDLEPFNENIPNQQAFYKEVGARLANYGQFYGIFVYPKSLTAETAALLNSSNNGYAIVALYDILDMKDGIPAVCNQDYTNTSAPCDVSATPAPVVATGDATSAVYDPTVPHSASGYYNAVLLSVKQTIALAAKNQVKYKLAIPVSSSVHEFENWGQYVCNFNNFEKLKPVNGFCRQYNGLPLNPNSGSPSQLQYVQMAIKAIRDGIEQMGTTFNPSYFRGIDFYSYGFRTIWTPQNPMVDYESGNIFYGNTPVSILADGNGDPQGALLNAPYIYTSPASPPNNVMTWLAANCIDPTQVACPTSTGSVCCKAGSTCSTNGCSST